jgi:hypothetical protein
MRERRKIGFAREIHNAHWNIDAWTLPREVARQKQKITKRTHFATPNYSITTTVYLLTVQNISEKRTHFAPVLDSPNRGASSFQAIPPDAGVSPTPPHSAFDVRRSTFDVSLCAFVATFGQPWSNPVKPGKGQKTIFPPDAQSIPFSPLAFSRARVIA